MIKVIKNPEIKKIISQFIIIYVLFIIIGTFIINYEIDNYKKMLVFNNTAIIGNIYSNPNLDINKEIKLITKNISEKEYIKGKEVLEKYGYNESIQLELIPLYKDIYKDTKIRFIGFTSIFFMFFLIIIHINYSKIYFKLDKVIKVSTEFIDGNFDSTLDYLEEGTFSRLNSNFNEMGKRLKMNIDELKNEKVFLKNLLSDISHQLKTPLSSLKVYNDIILSMEEFNKDEVLKLCTYSERQLNRMKYLIESLLKLAKLEAGALEFNLEKESIMQLQSGDIRVKSEENQGTEFIITFLEEVI